VLSEMGLPLGTVVSRQSGGNDSFREALKNIRKFNFTGYIKFSLSLEGKKCEGFISFDGGTPLQSVYIFEWDDQGRAGRVYMGHKAVHFLWEDSIYPQTTISLHGSIPLHKLELLFPGSGVSRSDLVPPPYLPALPMVGTSFEDPEVDKLMRAWVEKGYNLSALTRMLDRGREETLRAIPYFEANLHHMEGLRKRLSQLDTKGYEREAESVMRHTYDPERVKEAEGELLRLEQTINKLDNASLAEKEIREEQERKRVDEKMDTVYDLILQYHRMRTRGDDRMTCPECGSYLDSSGNCPICMAKGIDAPRFGRRINPRLTFDNFVVGGNSRFAEAAARAVANNPGEAYNPLFIYSRSGLGKSHLLQAIGNHLIKNESGEAVLYSSSELMESELIDSLKAGNLEEFRDFYSGHRVLLIDDVQFIAGKEETQEEFFSIFSRMMEEGKQLVLACDRMPKEIPSLSERLVTRFESGLIADIQPPNLETRTAIVKMMAENKELKLPQEVIELVAQVCSDSVRQLEGGLNRIVAFSSLMRSDITLQVANELLQYQQQQEGEEIERLSEGRGYLVEESRPETSHNLMVALMREGYRGLAITRGHPQRLKQKAGELPAQVLWLTDRESQKEMTLPPSLERLMLTIDEFMDADGSKVILLDDIQYLISNTTFEGVVRFIRSVVDRVQESPSVFILSVNPLSLTPRDLSIFEREMEVIES